MKQTSRMGSQSRDPLWYKDAVVYEVPIHAFSDKNGDGIGDLAGLEEKLDYLHDLGVTAIWLLPFYPSPLRDGGYDISNYTDVSAAHGTREDFVRLLHEAHARDIRVITELVLNHTSNEHAWFDRARKAPPGSDARDFYVWSDAPTRFSDARIIFKDFESSNWAWDPVAKAYYWHRFHAHQPDLNFDNPRVHEALFQVVDFWLDLGVDGMRLDAVPYLYEREGTNCENLSETHKFLKKLRAHVDARHEGRMLLAEANQWPSDAAAYFGGGDECHMNFHFPLMPRMFMAVELEDSFPIVDILRQTPHIPDSCQWATFLRNHDELTLEMVTDEDRDYMYRVYAEERTARINLGIRRRLAPLMRTRRRIELMNALLFALPGTPVLYYGDEIGMGDNIYLGDRDGVRTPMQWSSDRNAGFSRCNPQKLYLPVIVDPEYHYEAVNVEAQQNNPQSLLFWMKRLITLRKEREVFGRGSIEVLHVENHHALAFIRAHRGDRVLVVANLSRHGQYVELDLSRFRGHTPIDIFGRSRFPPIGAAPYAFTLGPHDFFFFDLEPPKQLELREEAPLRTITARRPLESVVDSPEARRALEAVLLEWIGTQRFFQGKGRARRAGTITDAVPLGEPISGHPTWITFFHVEYDSGLPETYVIPLAVTRGDHEKGAIGKILADGGATGVLLDALANGGFGAKGAEGRPEAPSVEQGLGPALLGFFRQGAGFSGKRGDLAFVPWPFLDGIPESATTHARLAAVEQSNTTIVFGDALGLKLFRQVEEGINPEFEVGQFLEEHHFKNTPRLAGAIEYRAPGRERVVVGMLVQWAESQGDAFQITTEAIDLFFDRVLADEAARASSPPFPRGPRSKHRMADVPPIIHDLVGAHLLRLELLGRRTAELHATLATETSDPTFGREPFSMLHQQSLFQYAHTTLARTFEALRKRRRALPEEVREDALALVAREPEIDARLARVTERKIDALRIRCHGDLHLGQVLFTGDDFLFIDFEGEPMRPLATRRYRRSPLRDVAGMLRSFDYAAATALQGGRVRAEDAPVLDPWTAAWVAWAEATYLAGYFEPAAGAPFLPKNDEDTELLLDFYLLEKCIYEIGYELENRPGWLSIPLRGVARLLESGR